LWGLREERPSNGEDQKGYEVSELKLTAIECKDHWQKVRDFHDAAAGEYRTQRYRGDTCEGLAYITRKEIVLAMADAVPGTVLDLGCGPGILIEDLLRIGHSVYSADLSMEMIEQARREANRGANGYGAHFVVSDASRICFTGNQMDVVLSIGLMCYVKDHGAVLSEIHRVLKPGGFVILQVNNIRWPAFYRMFVPLYHYIKARITSKDYKGLDFAFNFSSSKRFLKDLTDTRFNILDVEYYDFRIPFLDILLPRLSVGLGRFLFRKRHLRVCQWLAHGLVIKAGK